MSTSTANQMSAAAEKALRSSRIVIVDDESSNFMVLRKVLGDAGFSRVITTSDPTTAIDTIRKARPDLIVLDVVMPIMDGTEILQLLRADPEFADTPVLILTASEDPVLEQSVRALGVTDYLKKPIVASEFCKTVQETLTARVKAAEPATPAHPDYAALSRIEEAAPPAPVPARETPVRTKPAPKPRVQISANASPLANVIDEDRIRRSRIIVVDDEPFNFMVLRKFLADEGYTDILTTSDSTTAVQMIVEAQPDLIILDVVMPQVDGIQILTELKANPEMSHIPVLILTATADARVKKNALDIGATDFLNKPVESNDLLPRVRNSITFKLQRDQLRDYAGFLEDQVQLRTSELIESRRDIVRCLARAGEYRDTQTGHHVLRVGMYAGVLADELGFSPAEIEDIELAAQLHDLGKIAIPDSILLKPGKLTAVEVAEMRRHCRIGMKIIQPKPTFASPRSTGVNPNRLTQMAAMIASTHHERWDGEGYPCGLSGEQIPIEGRITAVADVFDALSSKRPYKEAFDFNECFDMIEAERGKHFDPNVLDALHERRDEIIEIRLSHTDESGH